MIQIVDVQTHIVAHPVQPRSYIVLGTESDRIALPLMSNRKRMYEFSLWAVWINLHDRCFTRCGAYAYDSLISLGPIEGGVVG